MRNELIKEVRTRNPLSDKPVKVRKAHGGALKRINSFTADEVYGHAGETDSLFGNMFGRIKAKRDAKASKKVRKAGTMTAKERKASKLESKNKLRSDKGTARKTKAKARTIKAEKGGGGKVADTLNKAMELGTELIAKKQGGGDEEVIEQEPKQKSNKNLYIFGGIGLVVLLVILFFIFKKK